MMLTIAHPELFSCPDALVMWSRNWLRSLPVPELEQLLQRLCEQDAFSGTVPVAKGNGVLFYRSLWGSLQALATPLITLDDGLTWAPN